MTRAVQGRQGVRLGGADPMPVRRVPRSCTERVCRPRRVHAGMLAGGTGITPMYQVLNAILKNKKDKTKVSLIFANLSVNDILLRNELAELEQAHPDRLSIYYVLNEAAEGWSGGVGFITPDMIHNNLPAPGEPSGRCMAVYGAGGGGGRGGRGRGGGRGRRRRSMLCALLGFVSGAAWSAARGTADRHFGFMGTQGAG